MSNVTFITRAIAEELPEDEVVISIGDPGQPHHFGNPLPLTVLRLEFDDVNEELGPEYRLFDHRDALKILRFIERHKGRDIFVHCEAGLSRSPAVAKFLIDKKGYVYKRHPKCSSSFDRYNRWVYRQLEVTNSLNL